MSGKHLLMRPEPLRQSIEMERMFQKGGRSTRFSGSLAQKRKHIPNGSVTKPRDGLSVFLLLRNGNMQQQVQPERLIHGAKRRMQVIPKECSTQNSTTTPSLLLKCSRLQIGWPLTTTANQPDTENRTRYQTSSL